MIRNLGLHEGTINLYSVNDNASNYHVALGESLYLEEFNCAIHTVPLGVIDTFKDVQGMANVVAKSKAIAKFVNKSTVAKNQLKLAVEAKRMKFKMPKNPCQTRWNSQYDNMVSLLPYKDVINSLSLNTDGWENKSIDAGGWALMEGACTVLESVKKLTKAFEGEKEPTMNKVVERLYTTHEELDKFIRNPKNATMKKGVGFAKTLKKKLDERFPNFGTNLHLARKGNYLDPRFRGLHLTSLGKFDSTKNELENIWNDIHGEPEEENPGQSTNDPASIDLSPTSKLRQKLQMRTQSVSQREQTKIRKEMSKYEALSVPPKATCILGWWNFHKKRFPILSSLARLVLAIPASSAKSK